MASKREVDEFIRRQWLEGKTKNVNDAFKEYPVEEEWHKGKIENILKNAEVVHGPYNKVIQIPEQQELTQDFINYIISSTKI